MALKIVTLVGTRPEIIKLSCILKAFDEFFDHILVHSGQNYDYELNEIFFNDLEIRKPNHFLNSAENNAGPAQTMANVIARFDRILEQEKPDAVFIYGDTNSCMGIISAKRRQIPIFHMEAGNRCFDQRVPEEINRKVVDHLSDINMVHSEHARRYLIAEGLKAETIIKTGSPMREILSHFSSKIDSSDALKKLSLTEGKYFVVSTHREENVDYPENLDDLILSLNSIAEMYNYPVIVSTHPRTRNKLEKIKGVTFHKNINFMKPLGFFDYVRLQKNAYCVLSDSGTITEESSLLNFPAIMIRKSHERPEGMDVGAVIMSGLKKERIMSSIEMVVKQFEKEKRPVGEIQDYSPEKVSNQVVRIVQSYTDYVNRTVWSKTI